MISCQQGREFSNFSVFYTALLTHLDVMNCLPVHTPVDVLRISMMKRFASEHVVSSMTTDQGEIALRRRRGRGGSLLFILAGESAHPSLTAPHRSSRKAHANPVFAGWGGLSSAWRGARNRKQACASSVSSILIRNCTSGVTRPKVVALSRSAC